MKIGSYIQYFILFLFFCQSCITGDKEIAFPELVESNRKVQVNYDSGYGLNQYSLDCIQEYNTQEGNTIISARVIPLDTFQSTLTNYTPAPKIQMDQKEVSTYSYNNVDLVQAESEIINTEDLKKHVPGSVDANWALRNSTGDTIETNVSKTIKGTIVKASFSEAIDAITPSTKDNNKYDIQFWAMDHGLPSSHIFKIYKDSRDHIWLGTRDAGAVRFNGTSFQQFGTEQGLSNDIVSDIIEDDNGNIWFSTGSGIFVFNGTEFINFSEAHGMANALCMGISKGKFNDMWISTFGGGLIHAKLTDKIDELNITHYGLHDGLSEAQLWPCHVDTDGNLWVGYYHDGLAKVVLDESGNYDYIINFDNAIDRFKDAVFQIAQKSDKEILFAGNYGVFIVKESAHGDKFKVTRIDEENGLRRQFTRSILYSAETNTIWAGTVAGLSKITEYGNGQYAVVNIGEPEGLSDDDVRSFYLDEYDQLWIGTKSSGLNRLRVNGLEHVRNEEQLMFENLQFVCEDSLLGIWTSSKFGVNRFEVKHSLEQSEITSCIREKNHKNGLVMARKGTGEIFMGGYNGMFRYKDNYYQRFYEETGLMAHDVRDIIVHSNGCVYVAMYSGGLSEVTFDANDNYAVRNFNVKSGLPGSMLFDIEEGDDGSIWIATDRGFSIIYPSPLDNKDSIINFTEKEGLSSFGASTITKSATGDMWIGTYSGVNRIIVGENHLPEQIIYYTKENGLVSNNIRAIAEDKEGNMWVSSDKGISRIDKNQQIKNFTKNDGLISVDFGMKSTIVDRNNVLWMGTSHSLSFIELDQQDFSNEIPRAEIDQIVISEEQLQFNQVEEDDHKMQFLGTSPFKNLPISLSLPHYKNHIQFSFSAVSWKNPESILYSYRVKELNEPWSTPSDSREADYRGLSPGNYTFQLIAAGPDRIWSEPVNYSFEIRPPWWLSWIAILIYVLMGIAGVAGFIRWRTYALKKKQKELETKIASATVEIRTQKEEIEVQHQEIKDSIAYAKRIQNAILPPDKLVKEYLNDSFVLYKPKDIVAGDFYWMEPQEERVLFAAADCTGHGVPGAMVSVICNNGLNRSVREFNLTDPAKILDKTRDIVLQEFEKSEEEVKDGMDIALCSLENDTSRASVSLKYAGAHNPLWVIRKGAEEVEEIKADKQPIGRFAEAQPFTSYEVELHPGDTFYIFSDGFADQFGGDKGKKFKTTNFKKLLLSIQNESMDRQKELIDEAFEAWRGNLEQLDDVCVIGVRV